MNWKAVLVGFFVAVFTYGYCSTIQTPEVEIIYRNTPEIYKSIGCVEADAIDKSWKVSATAFAINKSYLVTAGHFCKNVKTNDEIEDKISLIALNNNDQKIEVGILEVVDFGMKRDLCLLKLKKHGLIPISIVKNFHKNVRMGDDIAIVGAPNGIFPLETEGKVVEPFNEEQKITMGIAAYNGNSGSPVLNEANQAIGVVIEKDVQYHHIIYATPAHYLRKFLKKNKVVIH